MLISARYGIHGLNPRYALRVCSSGRAAVTAAAATKARERGIGGGDRAGERKGERWRRNTREEEEGSGRRDATQRATDFVSFSVLRDARERDFFTPGRPLRVVINVFNPGL